MAFKPFHKGKYHVTFKQGFNDCKRDITINVGKVFESDSLKILLFDEDDPVFLCVLIVTRTDYEDLKRQQGLLIDFDDFPSQLVRLLQQCATNNMFLIMQQTNPVQYYLEIVEHNEFKRLVHLSLKTAPATDNDIKQHMADTINYLKKSLSALKSSSSTSEALLNDKCINLERKIQDMTHILSKMEDDKKRREAELQEVLNQEREKFMQDKIHWQRNNEMNTKAQVENLQDIINRKDKQIDEMKTLHKQLSDNMTQLESQISDKSKRLSMLEKEVQKSHIEVATLMAKNTTLEKEITEKDKQINQLTSKCTFLEKDLKDNNDTIKDLNNSLQLIKKEKASLEERLAISDSLANKSNQAAQSTSEQLLKANQIISKQNSDLIEMKEKLLCRTAIALEQEKVIESNSKEIEHLKSQAESVKQTMDTLKSDLQNLKEKYECNEKALKDRDETIKNNNMVIQWLHKKMENHIPIDSQNKQNIGISSATSSTPYFISRNKTNSTQEDSNDSINFYATSKLSNLQDSPQHVDLTQKLGLDPKYLQPASENKDMQEKVSAKAKSSVKVNEGQIQKGKENKQFHLPKVDYREKKHKDTYRATPISAYFP